MRGRSKALFGSYLVNSRISAGKLAEVCVQLNVSALLQSCLRGVTVTHVCRRSVEDELKRESYTDASVVAVSYLVMLGYIALALAAIPPPQQFLQLFVLSRASLGAGGVLIVASSVAGAMGLCSMFGMWSTLIIMEVIPFLVLAVGVDNMFVLAHALGRQVRSDTDFNIKDLSTNAMCFGWNLLIDHSQMPRYSWYQA